MLISCVIHCPHILCPANADIKMFTSVISCNRFVGILVTLCKKLTVWLIHNFDFAKVKSKIYLLEMKTSEVRLSFCDILKRDQQKKNWNS